MRDASVSEPELPGRLPIHGFVLAGGKSSRMGVDKALLKLGGVPMVEIALEKLRSFCAEVSIAGNRDDLSGYAEVVHETRVDVGPAAGIEAGLRAAREPWVMFVPVDVPLVPAELLRRWCEEALRVNMTVSYLHCFQSQPAFCLMRCERAASFTRALDEGERRVEVLVNRAAEIDDYASWAYEAYELYGNSYFGESEDEILGRWFMNVNTREDLEEVERAAISDT
jgi:molybdopterin-guanine dinucleotide biosynthesis protein A